MKDSEIRKKAEQTLFKNHGVTVPAKSTKIVEKMSNTYKKSTGFSNPAHNPEVKEKKTNTCIKNHGVTHHMKLQQYKDKSLLYRMKNGYVKKIDLNGSEHLVSDLMKKYEYSRSAILHSYRLLSKEDFIKWLNREHDRSSSNLEKDILDFIKNNYSKTIEHRILIENKEVDIFLPELKLAIEVNGDYWHSYPLKDKTYHVRKKDIFDSNNLISMFIYESDWYAKKDIIKSMILNKLNKSIKIYARKCSIREVSNIEAYNFLQENHLQGGCNLKINLGLYLGNNLQCLVCFGKPRYNKNYEYELLRFCNKLNISVLGGFAKLFKYFIKKYNPINIISYADRDYSSGNLYTNNGFIFLKNTKFSYFYSKNYIRYNRLQFQKNKLKNKLKLYDSSKTELENMLDNRYLPIFTCGNSVYIWKN